MIPLINTKIPMANFYYKKIYTRVLFFLTKQRSGRHSNKAGQQTVPLVFTHKNDKALIMIK